MIRSRLSRPAAILTAVLALLLVGVAPTSAATPGWKFVNVQQLPSTVAPNGTAGFKFRILNDGKSNISQLFLTDSVNAAPTYFWNSRGTVCQTSPNLYCSFGALNSKAWIDVTIAYKAGTSNFANTFKLDSSGDPTGKNNSHGDSKLLSLTTAVSSSVNFDAGFVVDDQSYATGGSLGSGNKQISQIDLTDTLLPVTIEDGITSGIPCTIAQCANQIGEWTRLSVPGNTNLLKVTLQIWGGSVPGGVTANDISLVHTRDNGTSYLISTRCTPTTGTPTNAECIVVTKVGNNFRIVAWLTENGGLRGIY